MSHRLGIFLLKLSVPLLVLMVACSSESQDDRLVGHWQRGREVLRITSDGTYVVDAAGQLENNPDDSGTVKFDGETLTLVSSEESVRCDEGDLWVWEVEFTNDDQMRALITNDTCTPTEGSTWNWTRCNPGLDGDRETCEPVR